jgi:hypothetical protein
MVVVLVGPFTKAAYRWETSAGTLDIFVSLKAAALKKCKPLERLELSTAENTFAEVERIVIELDQQREELLATLKGWDRRARP